MQVVGESAYRESFKRIFGPRTPDGVDEERDARLVRELAEPARTEVRKKLYEALGFFAEKPLAAEDTDAGLFVRFGLTDAGIERASADPIAVLTDDFALAGYLTKQGIPAVNFTHLRSID